MFGNRVRVTLEAQAVVAHLRGIVLGQDAGDEKPAARVEKVLLFLGQVDDRKAVGVGGRKLLCAHVQLLSEAVGKNVGSIGCVLVVGRHRIVCPFVNSSG